MFLSGFRGVLISIRHETINKPFNYTMNTQQTLYYSDNTKDLPGLN